MRVAIPTEAGQIVRYFERAEEFTIYEVEIELIKSREVVPVGGLFEDFLQEKGINAIICGQIRSKTRNLLRSKRIELTYGVTGSADEIIIRYLSGERLGDIEENTLWHFENIGGKK